MFCLAATSWKAASSTRLRHRGTSILVRSAGDWVLTAERWLSEVVSKVTLQYSSSTIDQLMRQQTYIAVSWSHLQYMIKVSSVPQIIVGDLKIVQSHTLILWTKLSNYSRQTPDWLMLVLNTDTFYWTKVLVNVQVGAGNSEDKRVKKSKALFEIRVSSVSTSMMSTR